MHRYYNLVIALFVVCSCVSLRAQMKIDSIQIFQSWSPSTGTAKAPQIVPDTGGRIFVNANFSGLQSLFYLDTLHNRIFEYREGMMLGFPGDPRSEGTWSMRFYSADIYRYGTQYRVYMDADELRDQGCTIEVTYNVRVGIDKYEERTDTYGSDSNDFFEMIFFGSIPLGVSEKKNSAQFSVYPNPTSNFVTVEFPGLGHTIEVIDLLGRKQEVRFVEQTPNKCLLDVSSLPAGMYYINAGTNCGKILKK